MRASDIINVWMDEGWLYLAVVLDLYSRAMIGWVIGSRITANLAIDTLHPGAMATKDESRHSRIAPIAMCAVRRLLITIAYSGRMACTAP